MPEKAQLSEPNLAILYSFRRCPYAIRAHMALKYSDIKINLREIDLKNKPQEMLTCSAKGTVPILKLVDGTVIDESRGIMSWALEKHDPEQWLPSENTTSINHINGLLDDNDLVFKNWLDRYKYADRYPEQTAEHYRIQGEKFLTTLESRLSAHHFLMGNSVSIADIGIFPFIRQFAFVDSEWFEQSDYQYLQLWLNHFLQSKLFLSVMEKYPLWNNSAELVVSGGTKI